MLLLQAYTLTMFLIGWSLSSNTVGKLLEKIVAHRLAEQLEEKNLLPATLGSYRRGKDTWMNAAVLASDVYDAFEKKEETVVIALDL